MANISPRLEAELRRIENGPLSSEKPTGIGTINFAVRCPFDAREVLNRAKSVVKAIDSAALAGWPANAGVKPRLPEWFTLACAPPMSSEEAKNWLNWWRSLPGNVQAQVELQKDWDLDGWLYWMMPDNRQWFWWDAKLLEEYDHIAVSVEVEAWPFPWGALRWLFRAAGASDMAAER